MLSGMSATHDKTRPRPDPRAWNANFPEAVSQAYAATWLRTVTQGLAPARIVSSRDKLMSVPRARNLGLII